MDKQLPKAILAIAMKGKDRKVSAEEDSDTDSEGSTMELETAAEEVMQAFKDEDTEALAESLKSFIHLCQGEDY